MGNISKLLFSVALIGLVVVLCSSGSIFAQSPFGRSYRVGGDLSEGRTLGVGAQGAFPAFAGASIRFWVRDMVAVEGNMFTLGGNALSAVRGLFKVLNNPSADLYLAGGVTYLDNMMLGSHLALGMEYSFSYEVAMNAEVGMMFFTLAGSSTLLGGGIHFYF